MTRKRDTAVKIAIVVQIVVIVLGLAGFAIAFLSIQSERRHSATDTCYLFRKVVLTASPDKARGKAFLRKSGLGDCVNYGEHVTH